ncbi:MAG TPA: hypothetical protein VHK01_17200 [Lacipirellulaceae bacterium]|jgi:hypothetical protein|nr:hypothetical protein [Lacipirellulaceae bacterium]
MTADRALRKIGFGYHNRVNRKVQQISWVFLRQQRYRFHWPDLPRDRKPSVEHSDARNDEARDFSWPLQTCGGFPQDIEA